MQAKKNNIHKHNEELFWDGVAVFEPQVKHETVYGYTLLRFVVPVIPIPGVCDQAQTFVQSGLANPQHRHETVHADGMPQEGPFSLAVVVLVCFVRQPEVDQLPNASTPM